MIVQPVTIPADATDVTLSFSPDGSAVAVVDDEVFARDAPVPPILKTERHLAGGSADALAALAPAASRQIDAIIPTAGRVGTPPAERLR